MIDEKTLQDRLTAAAEEQDTLLPRALADDLTAGRRRLLRRRLLAGASATVAVAAVAAAATGLVGPLRNAAQDQTPAANQDHTTSEADAAAAAQIQGFDTLMTGLVVKHFDPAKQHLDLSTGPFQIDSNIGSHGTSHKVGWKVAGQRGEGMVLIQLSRSEKQGVNSCGSYNQPAITCHRITLPNGRSAMIGRRRRSVEFSYLQPDGEFAYIALDPLFGNNTTVPVQSVGITDAQLTAFVTDPELNLPPLTAAQRAQEDQLKNFAPAPQAMEAVAAQRLAGKLERTSVTDRPGQVGVEDTWTKGGVSATVEIAVTAAPVVVGCPDALSVPDCTPVQVADGSEAQYHQGARTYQGGNRYVIGATHVQPDGDMVSVRVLYPGESVPAQAVSRAEILALVSDPAFDR